MRRTIGFIICILAMVTFGGIAKADLNNGLIAYYPFDGNANDMSGNGHNGIVSGATLCADRNGKANSAYSFDGVNDYIKIPHHSELNFSNDFSIAFWVKSDSSAGTRVMLAKGQDCGNSYFFGWSGANRFNVSYGLKWCGMTGTGNVIPINEWHFVTVVVDSIEDKMYYYLDGVLKKTVSINTFTTRNTYPLVIGRHFTCANGGCGYEYPFAGDIDEVRLYNRLLEPEEIEELCNLFNPKITIVSPKLPSVQRSGDQVLIAWKSENTDPNDEIMISMKRLSVPLVQMGPDGHNWHEFVLTDNANDGYEIVTIPEGIDEADDWNFYVKHVISGKWDSTDETFEISATERNWGVPYLSQKDYPNNMKESACGPTSLTMLLQYYYPNSQIDMPVVYHAGTQTYQYQYQGNGGPAYAYKNVSFALGDSGLSVIDSNYNYLYVGTFSGTTIVDMTNYLDRIWGIQSTTLSTAEEVSLALATGPILGHVYAHGNTNWGHFVVIRGIDNDYVYINDPYDSGWGYWDTDGENKSIRHQDFFTNTQKRCGTDANGNPIYCYAPWFRYAYQLTPQDTPVESLYSLIVDTGHNDFEGYADPHFFTLFNEEAETVTGEAIWKFYYAEGGDWYYPIENGQSARWTPSIAINGYYRVEVRYRADKQSGIVTYNTNYFETITASIDQELDQNSEEDYEWRTGVIVDSMYLGAGCYVEASNIPVNTNIDAVKFIFLHQ